MAEAGKPSEGRTLLAVEDLAKDFDVSRPWLNRVIEGAPRQLLKAVDGVSFSINRGETLSLVGESGCGKSTVARLIGGLYAPSRGRVVFDGADMGAISSRSEMLGLRRRFQMIFQDPYASLNPRWRVSKIVAEPIRSHDLIKEGAAIRGRVGVMYLGRIVEIADTKTLFDRPLHPYTRMLQSAIPDITMSGKARTPVAGEVPNPLDPPTGCTFNPRCPHAREKCREVRPDLLPFDGASVACHGIHDGWIPIHPGT